jgi:hypothetical protein
MSCTLTVIERTNVPGKFRRALRWMQWLMYHVEGLAIHFRILPLKILSAVCAARSDEYYLHELERVECEALL